MGLLNRMGQRSATAGELIAFLRRRKIWWMLPLIAILLAFSTILYLASLPPVSPFVYILF